MSTAPPDIGLPRLARARLIRRGFFAVLTAFLVLGMLGVFGVRTADGRASGGGYELSVHYARVSRPGLSTPWSVTVSRPGGLGVDSLTLVNAADYLEAFDENSLDPEPVDASSDGERSTWTFDVPPDAEVFEVTFDGRIEPGVQFQTVKGDTQLVVGGTPATSVSYRTFVMP